MIYQQWLWWWLGAITHQVITRANVNKVLWCHIASLGHNFNCIERHMSWNIFDHYEQALTDKQTDRHRQTNQRQWSHNLRRLQMKLMAHAIHPEEYVRALLYLLCLINCPIDLRPSPLLDWKWGNNSECASEASRGNIGKYIIWNHKWNTYNKTGHINSYSECNSPIVALLLSLL